MVNQTCLATLIQYIRESNLRPMKPWNQRAEKTSIQYVRKLKQNVRTVLNLISGGDIVSMIKSVLLKSEMDEIFKDRKEAKALNNMAECYNNTNLKKRYHFANALKKSKLSLKRVRSLGFPVTSRLWKNCSNGLARNKGGGKTITQELRDVIREYLLQNSNEASNRLVINKDQESEDYNQSVNAKYLEKNMIELYKSFPKKNELHFSTFRAYVKKSNEFKKPFRFTDLCSYCELLKDIKIKLSKLLEIFKIVWGPTFDIKSTLVFLEQKKRRLNQDIQSILENDERQHAYDLLEKVQTAKEYLLDYDAILFHQDVARAQREAYNKQRKEVDELRNKILIEVDFKEQIVIGISPRQISEEFYEKDRKRSCLGFGVYYVDNDEIKLINFDLISNDKSQDSEHVVRGFRMLMRQDFFKKFDDIKDYIVWADCGKHFRNNVVCGYLLIELAKEHNIRVNLNFFGDKHGKNSRDSHFSHVSQFVNDASLQKRLMSAHDIADAINQGQKFANENKMINNKGKPVVTCSVAMDLVDELDLKKQNLQIYQLTIKNIESFYNYRTIGRYFKLATSILSNNNDLLDLKPESISKIQNIYEVIAEKDLVNHLDTSKIKNLSSKRDRINAAFKILRERENDNNSSNINPSHLQQPNNPLLSFFSKRQFEGERVITTQEGEGERNTQEIPKPEYCRDGLTDQQNLRKKEPCKGCRKPCLYTIARLDRKEVSQDQINEELYNHNHPKSRKLLLPDGTSHQRTAPEGRKELIAHYKYAHHLQL